MKLFDHQLKVLKETKNKKRVAYFMDMGLGKTYVGSEKMKELNAQSNLIVCQKSKVKDWVDHYNEHYGDYLIFNLTNRNEYRLFLLESKEIDEDYPHKIIGVINYDLIFRRPELLELSNNTLVLDESSLIQNNSSKRTKAILKMKPANVILLSGTPVNGKYENLYSQMKLLGWKGNKRHYENKFINFKMLNLGAKQIRIVDPDNPYKNVDELKQELMNHNAIFMKTEECYDLPSQNIIEVKVEKPKLYDKFKRTKVVKINDEYIAADNKLSERLYLRQMASLYNNAKFAKVKDLIESTNDRLIIFYNFKKELEALEQLTDKPKSYVNGSKKDLTAYENEVDSVTFIQYQAGSMGLNLQKANKIIYFSLPESSELFEQSKKRIHRIGQDKHCFYYLMLMENSIDEWILNALKLKKDYTDELFRRDICE